MYPNLNAECARKNITLEKMVEELEKRNITMSIGTLSQKKTGKYKFTLNEAKAIKDIIKDYTGKDIPLEELFEEAS